MKKPKENDLKQGADNRAFVPEKENKVKLKTTSLPTSRRASSAKEDGPIHPSSLAKALENLKDERRPSILKTSKSNPSSRRHSVASSGDELSDADDDDVIVLDAVTISRRVSFDVGKAALADITEGFTEEAKAELEAENRIIVRGIYKNVVLIAFGMWAMYLALVSLMGLQSSLYREGNLGMIGLSVNASCVVLAGLTLPPLAIQLLGYKWTLVSSYGLCGLWICAQLYPTWYTILPANVAMGVGWVLCFTATSSAMTILANQHCQVTQSKVEIIINRFFGISLTSLLTAPIVASFIAGPFLSNDETALNGTSTDPIGVLEFCGKGFCPKSAGENDTIIEPPDSNKVNILVYIKLSIIVFGSIITAIFMDNIEGYKIYEEGSVLRANKARRSSLGLARAGEKKEHQILKSLKGVFKQMADPYQILLLPMTVFIGVYQAFAGSDIPSDFVSCAYGIQTVPTIVIFRFASCAVATLVVGPIANKIGRFPVSLTGCALLVCKLVLVLIWTPNTEQLYMLMIITIVGGIGEAVIQAEINVLYGKLFSENSAAAFANYRSWNGLGLLMAYTWAGYICTLVKILLCSGFLVAGTIAYVCVEIKLKVQERKENELNEKEEIKDEEKQERKEKTENGDKPSVEKENQEINEKNEEKENEERRAQVEKERQEMMREMDSEKQEKDERRTGVKREKQQMLKAMEKEKQDVNEKNKEKDIEEMRTRIEKEKQKMIKAMEKEKQEILRAMEKEKDEMMQEIVKEKQEIMRAMEKERQDGKNSVESEKGGIKTENIEEINEHVMISRM